MFDILYILILTVSILCAPIIWWYWYISKFKSLNKIPGPTPLPLIGNALDLGQSSRETYLKLKDLHTKYGGIFKIFVGTDLSVVISKPELMETVLSSNVQITKSHGYDLIKSWFGDGLLVSTGSKWRSRRKLITPTFHFRILDKFTAVFNSKADILVEQLAKEVGTKSVNIYPYVNVCNLDVMLETSLGAKLNVQKNYDREYLNAVRGYLGVTFNRFFSSWKRYELLFRLSPEYQPTMKNLKTLHNFTLKIIEQRRNEFRQSDQLLTTSNDEFNAKPIVPFLDLLLRSENSNTLTNKDLQEEIDTLLFEGHDTVSSGTSFALLALAENPDVQQKLYDEVCQVIGGTDKCTFISSQHLNEMKYLDLVLKECQRMYPSVPFIERRLTQDFQLGGHTLPKGTTINLQIFAMHHSAEYYPNPSKFDPDRFSLENKIARHNYGYVPFSAGSRNCIGQKYAISVMKTNIVKILLNYKLTAVPGFVPELCFIGVLTSINGVDIRLENR